MNWKILQQRMCHISPTADMMPLHVSGSRQDRAWRGNADVHQKYDTAGSGMGTATKQQYQRIPFALSLSLLILTYAPF
jgi:hypothetical protein